MELLAEPAESVQEEEAVEEDIDHCDEPIEELKGIVGKIAMAQVSDSLHEIHNSI